MIETIKHYWSIPNFVFWIYWVPTMVALLYIAVTTVAEYLRELKRYKVSVLTDSYFSASLTIGEVLGNTFLCFLPFVNWYIACFRFIPDSVVYSLKFIGSLDFKLVPDHIPTKSEFEKHDEKLRLRINQNDTTQG